jgi:hypothetical protein
MNKVAVLGLCLLSTGLVAAEPSPRRPLALTATGYTFPSAANAQGALGAYFRTRLVLTNPGSSAISVTASLSTPIGSGGIRTITLGPAETRVYGNFLDDVFGYTGGGGFSLTETTGSRPFYAVGEVYTENAGGRFGTALMAMSAADRVVNLASGETGYSTSTGLVVDASSRANIGCTNADATPAVVRADVYNETSAGPDSPAATVTLTIPSNGWAQAAVPASGEKVKVLFWQLSAGGLYGSYCYGVNVNNQSGDGLSVPAAYAPLVP